MTTLPDILMNCAAVYAEVQRLRNNNHRTSPENVADVLDAIASLLRGGELQLNCRPAEIAIPAVGSLWVKNLKDVCAVTELHMADKSDPMSTYAIVYKRSSDGEERKISLSDWHDVMRGVKS